MSNIRQRLERIVKKYEGILDDPCMGHTLLVITMPGEDPDKEPLPCMGCGRDWTKLEANNFLPVCTNPTGITEDVSIEWPLEGDA